MASPPTGTSPALPATPTTMAAAPGTTNMAPPTLTATSTSTSLPVPPSPTASSKRSRSRDSTRPLGNTSLTASTPNLVIPTQSQQPPTPASEAGAPSPTDNTPYPAFLRLGRPGIEQVYAHLEWEQRKRLLPTPQAPDTDQSLQWSRPSGAEVVRRNRYNNVDPFQSNRVKLKVPEGHDDYINASLIELRSTRSNAVTRFIATQGPKSDSFSHIWRMIWNESASSATIIMLTQTHEMNREKCFAYYPQSPSQPDLKINSMDEFDDGFEHNLTLASLTEDESVKAQIREMDLSNQNGTETRKIWHYLFAGWPDFSVPEGPQKDALLKLIDISREKNVDNAANARVVHCSAGVGRTGTFIALDWLLQELDQGALDDVDEDNDPIQDIVNELRSQRMLMVQGPKQLAFIYDVIRECWRERWARLHQSQNAPALRDGEPKLKRQKSNRDADLPADMDGQELAGVEAELGANDADFDKGDI